jgi:hypothetical protein
MIHAAIVTQMAGEANQARLDKIHKIVYHQAGFKRLNPEGNAVPTASFKEE